MPLQAAKGSLVFHRDKIPYFATRHGGLNEWSPDHGWRSRPMSEHEKDHFAHDDPSSADNHDNIHRDNHELHHSLMYDTVRKVQKISKAEKERKALGVKPEPRMFTSSMRQRLVSSRLLRLAHVNLPLRLRIKSADEAFRVVKKKLNGNRSVNGRWLFDLMVACGGWRGTEVFPPTQDGKTSIAKISNQVFIDHSFKVRPDETTKLTPKLLHLRFSDSISYEDVMDAVAVLEQWWDKDRGPGRLEHFVGTLKGYQPLHDKHELRYLREEWGSFQVLTRPLMEGFNSEGPDTPSFSSAKNRTHDHALPWSLTYQPIYEIRNYYGDDVGLYFAWLGMYTQALFMLSLFGAFTMVLNLDIFYGNVDKNPMTLAYSVYVGFWSISFLETWSSRELELEFLWASGFGDETHQSSPVRAQFNGAVETNVETGSETLIHKSALHYLLKRLMSGFIIFLWVVVTAFSAYQALYIRIQYKCQDSEQPSGKCSFWETAKPELLSAGANLTVIVGFGAIYKEVAEKLNDWENHRTEEDYDDSLVAKQFIFQFFNNYFILFYIAYVQQFPDPIWQHVQECEFTPGATSCLGDLQFQLMIVFTGKVLGKQISYTAKPFVFKWLQATLMAKKVNGLVNTADNQGTRIIDTLPRGTSHVTLHLEQFKEATERREKAMQNTGHKAIEVKKKMMQVDRRYWLAHATDTENQVKDMPYEGVFDDWNERAIQFGYLVLFAPAYPLGPLLAFINNVFEMRAASFKLCAGYQRPTWKHRTGIGAWHTVMNLLGFLAVITNASMVAFVGSQMAVDLDLFDPKATVHYEKDDSGILVFFQDSETVQSNSSSSGSWGGLEPQLFTRFPERLYSVKLCWVFFFIEHAVSVFRFIIIGSLNGQSEWIDQAKEILEYRKTTLYRTMAQIQKEADTKEQYHAKMNHNHEITLEYASKVRRLKPEVLSSKLAHYTDRNGTMSFADAEAVMHWMGLNLISSEIQLALHRLSKGENRVNVAAFESMWKDLYYHDPMHDNPTVWVGDIHTLDAVDSTIHTFMEEKFGPVVTAKALKRGNALEHKSWALVTFHDVASARMCARLQTVKHASTKCETHYTMKLRPSNIKEHQHLNDDADVQAMFAKFLKNDPSTRHVDGRPIDMPQIAVFDTE